MAVARACRECLVCLPATLLTRVGRGNAGQARRGGGGRGACRRSRADSTSPLQPRRCVDQHSNLVDLDSNRVGLGACRVDLGSSGGWDEVGMSACGVRLFEAPSAHLDALPQSLCASTRACPTRFSASSKRSSWIRTPQTLQLCSSSTGAMRFRDVDRRP